jgi:hypothetical protein
MGELSDIDRYKRLLQAGLIITLMIGYGIYSNLDTLRWPFVDTRSYRQTVGQIQSSKVDAGGLHGGWRFRITYTYRVGNREFVSDRVHFGYQAMDNPSYANSYVEKYPAGKEVVVFYDENYPGNSVLEPSVKWSGLLNGYLLFLLVPIMIFSLAAYYYVKSHR